MRFLPASGGPWLKEALRGSRGSLVRRRAAPSVPALASGLRERAPSTRSGAVTGSGTALAAFEIVTLYFIISFTRGCAAEKPLPFYQPY